MKWKNVPIPEGHLVPLIVGIILHILHPLYIVNSAWTLRAGGAITLISGILIAGWCVKEVNSIEIDTPIRLITTGPYQLSRNPMYVAWSLIFIAVALLVNSLWLLLLFPPVLVYTHFFVILHEEKELEEIFGTEYQTYKSKVKRYI